MNRKQALEMLEKGHQLCFGYRASRSPTGYEPLMPVTRINGDADLGLFITKTPQNFVNASQCIKLDWLPELKGSYRNIYEMGSYREALNFYFESMLVCPETLLPMATI